MLQGRQFYLLRVKKNISRDRISEKLGLTSNDITIYENGIKDIPEDIYNCWIEIVK